MTRYAYSISVFLIFACEEDNPSPADGSTGEVAESSSSSTGAAPEASAFDCEGEVFAPSPLAGPGIDPDTGAIVGAPSDMYILHSTQAVVNPDGAAEFQMLSGQIIGELQSAPGLIGFSVAADTVCGFGRTLGVWDSVESITDFVRSGTHVQAMAKTKELTLLGRFTHFEIDPAEIDTAWDVAIAELDAMPASPVYDD